MLHLLCNTKSKKVIFWRSPFLLSSRCVLSKDPFVFSFSPSLNARHSPQFQIPRIFHTLEFLMGGACQTRYRSYICDLMWYTVGISSCTKTAQLK